MITVLEEKIGLDDLRKIEPTVPADAGRRWRPIKHADLVDTLRDEIVTYGWKVLDEQYAMGEKGAEMVGAFLIDGVRGVAMPAGVRLALGFVNNNARRRALRLTVGASVLCCTNGVCSGSIILNRAHDHSFDLADEVEAAVDRYALAALEMGDMTERLRSYTLAPATASNILMRAGREKLVGWTTIGRVDKEYRNPTFAEHGRDNSWALLNAFTYAARQYIHPTRQMDIYEKFQKMLPMASLN